MITVARTHEALEVAGVGWKDDENQRLSQSGAVPDTVRGFHPFPANFLVW